MFLFSESTVEHPLVDPPNKKCNRNECTKSANPRCLYDGHFTMHRTEACMHACPSSFDYGYMANLHRSIKSTRYEELCIHFIVA